MTDKILELLEAARALVSVMGQNAQPKYAEFMEKYELEGMDAYLAQITSAFSPDPIGFAQVIKRGPYGNPKRTKENFAGAVERGWLEEISEGAFVASQKSLDLYHGLYQVAANVYDHLADLISADIESLFDTLSNIIQNIKETDVIKDKHAFAQGMQFRSKRTDKHIVRDIRNMMIDLMAFRDDVHVAAWQDHQLEGYTWEAFSYLWEDKAHTAAELNEALNYRGYQDTDYQVALDELTQRGWAAESEGKYTITDQGKQIREEAEALTDKYFAAVFEGVDQEELVSVIDLIEQVKEQIQPVVEPQA